MKKLNKKIIPIRPFQSAKEFEKSILDGSLYEQLKPQKEQKNK